MSDMDKLRLLVAEITAIPDEHAQQIFMAMIRALVDVVTANDPAKALELYRAVHDTLRKQGLL